MNRYDAIALVIGLALLLLPSWLWGIIRYTDLETALFEQFGYGVWFVLLSVYVSRWLKHKQFEETYKKYVLKSWTFDPKTKEWTENVP